MKIKIIHCSAYGQQFKNLKDGSIHDVIKPPKGKEHLDGWWVMGVGEPIRVLKYEAIVISE